LGSGVFSALSWQSRIQVSIYNDNRRTKEVTKVPATLLWEALLAAIRHINANAKVEAPT